MTPEERNLLVTVAKAVSFHLGDPGQSGRYNSLHRMDIDKALAAVAGNPLTDTRAAKITPEERNLGAG